MPLAYCSLYMAPTPGMKPSSAASPGFGSLGGVGGPAGGYPADPALL